MVSLELLNHCQRCDKLGGDHVAPRGSHRSGIVVIVANPTVTDKEANTLMTGIKGEVLEFMFDEAGIDFNDVYVTSVIKCAAFNGYLNKQFPKQEATTCMQIWLKLELAKSNPKILVLVGKEVWDFIAPQFSKQATHGTQAATPNRKILFVDHPMHYCDRVEAYTVVGKTLKEMYADC